MKVELSEEADAQVKQIDVWWRANRLAAADLFTNELEAALTALGGDPDVGTRIGLTSFAQSSSRCGNDAARRLRACRRLRGAPSQRY